MNKKFKQYFKAYTVANVLAMVRNNKRDPLLCPDRSEGKLAVITGATSGIGYATAKEFASKGADVLCINRNQQKSEALKREIEESFGVNCSFIIADLSRMEEVFKVAEQLANLEKHIDVLIHNAGVYLTRQEFTEEGIDKVFMVQFLASFIINNKLISKLKAQDHARILLVNSEGHRFAPWGLKLDDLNWKKHRYSGLKSYGSAKLAQLLTMLIFNDIFQESGVTINAMHPGAVKTETGQENGRLYRWYKRNILDRSLRPVTISSDALYYLGVSPEMASIGGKFYNLTTLEEPSPPALDKEVAQELWDLSLKLCGLKNPISDGE